MKRTPLRPRKNNTRTFLCLALCMILALGVFTFPASGAESARAAAPAEEPTAVLQQPAEDSPEPTGEAASAMEEQEVSVKETEEETDSSLIALTFQMGSFGTKTVLVEKGQYPQEPQVPALQASTFLGWFDEDGKFAHPGSVPATANATYTARWNRDTKVLLNTDSHSAYIQGYSSGVFKPENGVTRAEAAQMFYTLLRQKEWEGKSFSDVAGDKWYYNAISTMAGLGIINGYTDGTFKPNKQITRAEFVTMAVNCSNLDPDAELTFPDVKADSWAAPYIATAAAKGWVGGFTDGSFKPSSTITRAQAVVILNHILGRVPDENVADYSDVKSFYDMFPDHWAYAQITEASASHNHYSTGTKEIWTSYTKDSGEPIESGWIEESGARYYLDAATRKCLRGKQVIDGKTYEFDSRTGMSRSYFAMVNGYRRYYKNGVLAEDISDLGVVTGPYFIKVYKNSNYLIIFAKDENGNYNIPVKAMRTSCGYGTPVGTFYTPSRYRWLRMEGYTWAQWCTQITGSYLFHSVPNWTKSNMDLEVEEYNHLGDTRSMGCIRLNCANAKWIYENCGLGTRVLITTGENSGPLAKPAGLAPLPSWHTWDPTDPTANWKCKQNGCH